MLPLISNPGTRCAVIRKTTKQLSGSGSLFDAAIELYSKIDPKLRVKTRDLTLVFSSGAEIQFTYLDKPADRMNLQGREYSRLCFDEAQQLDGENVFYALSRLRSTRVTYPLQAFMTCNPDPDSFLMKFVESSLDEHMVPIRKDKYEERYFIKDKDGFTFFDTRKEAEDRYGGGEDSPVKSMLFVPGSIIDNPRGLELNKDYISTLKALPPVECRRLLYGAWVREQSAGYYQRAWSKVVFEVPYIARRVRGFDLAGSLVDEVNKDPDYSATVLLSKTKEGRYTVEHADRIRERFHTVEQWMFSLHETDPYNVSWVIPIDPGAAGKAYASNLQKQLAEKGRHCVLQPSSTKSKLIRFRPLASVAQAGYVDILSDDWNTWFFNELEQFVGDGKTHDDALDAACASFWYLNQSKELPNIQMPDLSQFSTILPSSGITFPTSGLSLPMSNL